MQLQFKPDEYNQFEAKVQKRNYISILDVEYKK